MLLTLLNLVVKSEMNLMLNAHETNRFIFEKKRKRRYEQGQSKIFIQKYFLVLDDNAPFFHTEKDFALNE
jgi:hypothetical protein